MSFLKKRRFWSEVSISENDTGFSVLLDGRVLKTPQKADLSVPSLAAAQFIADEWGAVEEEIDPVRMPATRWANVAIDRVRARHGEVVDLLASYGETDLVCYRASHPEALIVRQAAAWDEVLGWVQKKFDVEFKVTNGVIPVAQPNRSVSTLRSEIAELDSFRLSAFHDLVHISGSLILSLAFINSQMSIKAAWDASQVDEIWQKEQWGRDEEAEKASEEKYKGFEFAGKLFNSVSITQ